MSPSEITLTPLRAETLPEFQRLLAHYFDEMQMAPEPASLDQDTADPLAVYGQPRAGLWLALHPEGYALGMAGLRPIANRTGELKRFYVLPEARRHGCGQALLNQVLNFARFSDYLEVLLAIWPSQKGALALCERNGFKPCARYNQDRRAGIFLSYRFAMDS